QAAFVVIDEDAGGDVHRVAQEQALHDAALAEDLLDLRGDVDEGHLRWDVQRQVFGEGFHRAASAIDRTPGRATSAAPLLPAVLSFSVGLGSRVPVSLHLALRSSLPGV